MTEANGAHQLGVKQAISVGTQEFNDDVQDSAISFEVQLMNDYRVQFHAFLCYDGPVRITGPPSPMPHHAGVSQHIPQVGYQWGLVERHACSKGCQGPVLRAIQRFGKLSKRPNKRTEDDGRDSIDPIFDKTSRNMKDPRFMYISFDEAGTHVAAKSFRMVYAVYDRKGRRLLATGASLPFRVLSNNDVPTGAAHLQLVASIPENWEGWLTAPIASQQMLVLSQAAYSLGGSSVPAAAAAHIGVSPMIAVGSTKRSPRRPTHQMSYNSNSESDDEADPNLAAAAAIAAGVQPAHASYRTRTATGTRKRKDPRLDGEEEEDDNEDEREDTQQQVVLRARMMGTDTPLRGVTASPPVWSSPADVDRPVVEDPLSVFMELMCQAQVQNNQQMQQAAEDKGALAGNRDTTVMLHQIYMSAADVQAQAASILEAKGAGYDAENNKSLFATFDSTSVNPPGATGGGQHSGDISPLRLPLTPPSTGTPTPSSLDELFPQPCLGGTSEHLYFQEEPHAFSNTLRSVGGPPAAGDSSLYAHRFGEHSSIL